MDKSCYIWGFQMIGWMLCNPNKFHYLVAKQQFAHVCTHPNSLYKTNSCPKICTQDDIVTFDTQQESEKVPCHSLAPQSVTLLAKKSNNASI